MADQERYYGIGVFSMHWKNGEEPIERGLIKGTSSLVDLFTNGTDSIKDFHGIKEGMYEGLEIRVVRVSKEHYDSNEDMKFPSQYTTH